MSHATYVPNTPDFESLATPERLHNTLLDDVEKILGDGSVESTALIFCPFYGDSIYFVQDPKRISEGNGIISARWKGEKPSNVVAVKGDIDQVMEFSHGRFVTDLSKSDHGVIIPMPGKGSLPVFAFVRLRPRIAPAGESQVEALTALADAWAAAAPWAASRMRAKMRWEQTTELRAIITRNLLAPDRQTLAIGLNEIPKSLFGFERTLFLVRRPHTHALRPEIVDGFDDHISSISIPLLKDADYSESDLVAQLEEGMVKVYDGFETETPELKSLIGDEKPGQAILVPFMIGGRIVGMLYADRPRYDRHNLLPELLEIFSTYGAVALENANLRIDAEHSAMVDSLTGLYNRSYLERTLVIEKSRLKRDKKPFSIVLIDLRDFKRSNAEFGHSFGDHVLREASALIQSIVRAHNVVIRYGGDEFAILLPGLNDAAAKVVCSRIEEQIASHNESISVERLRINTHIVSYTAPYEKFDTLLRDAENVLNEKKVARQKQKALEALLGFPGSNPADVDQVVRNFFDGLKQRLPNHFEQSRAVAHLCVALASGLELTQSEIWSLLLAAILRDVGEITLAPELLQKDGPLDEAERKTVQMHPILGEEFFRGIPYLEASRPIIRHHHERFDGSTEGDHPAYPNQLSGEDIPIAARILKLADVMAAMLADRPYRKAFALAEVQAAVVEETGKAFDPAIVACLPSPEWFAELGNAESFREDYRRELAAALVREQEIGDSSASA